MRFYTFHCLSVHRAVSLSLLECRHLNNLSSSMPKPTVTSHYLVFNIFVYCRMNVFYYFFISYIPSRSSCRSEYRIAMNYITINHFTLLRSVKLKIIFNFSSHFILYTKNCCSLNWFQRSFIKIKYQFQLSFCCF